MMLALTEGEAVQVAFANRVIASFNDPFEISTQNRIIDLQIRESKARPYDTCFITLENNDLFYNRMFDAYKLTFEAGARFDLNRTLAVRIKVGYNKYKQVFRGVVKKSRVTYDATAGFRYEIEAVSYEWILYKAKLKKGDGTQKNEDPTKTFLPKLIREVGLKYESQYWQNIPGKLYKGIKFWFNKGTSYLTIIKKMKIYHFPLIF